MIRDAKGRSLVKYIFKSLAFDETKSMKIYLLGTVLRRNYMVRDRQGSEDNEILKIIESSLA